MFVVIKDQQGNFRVKNTNTGKVGRDRFKSRANAEIQRKNRERFIKLIQQKTSLGTNGKKKKKKK
tara:strand:+ start:9402 stop:9596 length:195 start_codon:yes stop_codon:yes gene_type:complete